MLSSLDALIVAFMGISAVSLLAICLVFFVRRERIRKILLCFLALQGMLIAWMNALMTPPNYPGELLLGWALGAMGVAALLMGFLGKSRKVFLAARILAAVSVAAGLFNAFLY